MLREGSLFAGRFKVLAEEASEEDLGRAGVDLMTGEPVWIVEWGAGR